MAPRPPLRATLLPLISTLGREKYDSKLGTSMLVMPLFLRTVGSLISVYILYKQNKLYRTTL